MRHVGALLPCVSSARLAGRLPLSLPISLRIWRSSFHSSEGPRSRSPSPLRPSHFPAASQSGMSLIFDGSGRIFLWAVQELTKRNDGAECHRLLSGLRQLASLATYLSAALSLPLVASRASPRPNRRSPPEVAIPRRQASATDQTRWPSTGLPRAGDWHEPRARLPTVALRRGQSKFHTRSTSALQSLDLA